MSNINIVGCNFKENHLIDVQAGAFLQYNNEKIKNNTGNQTIFNVCDSGSLHLNGIGFRKNIQIKESIPSCINAQKGHIKIANCQFLEHTSEYYQWSAFLISTTGNLNIGASSIFKNNKAATMNSFCCIKV